MNSSKGSTAGLSDFTRRFGGWPVSILKFPSHSTVTSSNDPNSEQPSKFQTTIQKPCKTKHELKIKPIQQLDQPVCMEEGACIKKDQQERPTNPNKSSAPPSRSAKRVARPSQLIPVMASPMSSETSAMTCARSACCRLDVPN